MPLSTERETAGSSRSVDNAAGATARRRIVVAAVTVCVAGPAPPHPEVAHECARTGRADVAALPGHLGQAGHDDERVASNGPLAHQDVAARHGNLVHQRVDLRQAPRGETPERRNLAEYLEPLRADSVRAHVGSLLLSRALTVSIPRFQKLKHVLVFSTFPDTSSPLTGADLVNWG